MAAWVINTWPLELEHDLTATEVGGGGVKADLKITTCFLVCVH